MSVTLSRQTSLQAWITQKIGNLQRLSYITTRTRYYKKGVSEKYIARFWVWSWQKWRAWGWRHSRLYGLCQKVSNMTATKTLLSSNFIKKPSWGKEYLRASIGNLASSKVYHYLSQKQLRKAISNFFI